jgi:hypothetical protein
VDGDHGKAFQFLQAVAEGLEPAAAATPVEDGIDLSKLPKPFQK